MSTFAKLGALVLTSALMACSAADPGDDTPADTTDDALEALTSGPAGKPPVILSYFNAGTMLKAFAGIDTTGKDTGLRPLAHLPAATPVYLGNYGVDKTGTTSALIAQAQTTTKASLRYAPMFSLVFNDGYTNRHAGTVDDFDQSSASLFDYSGPIPAGADGKWTPATIAASVAQKYTSDAQRQLGSFQWGRELGKRMRDTIEAFNVKAPVGPVAAWQLDEVSPSAGTNPDVAARDRYRELIRGVMIGLTLGRTQAGTGMAPMRGMVFIASPAFVIATEDPSRNPEVALFWKTMSECAMFIIGEEYPTPSAGSDGMHPGDSGAQTADDKWSRGQNRYKSGFLGNPAVGNAIASKWIAGMSPGYSPEIYTGHVPDGMSREYANTFRRRYVLERASQHVAGFGEYSWLGGNVDPVVANDVMADLAAGLQALQR